MTKKQIVAAAAAVALTLGLDAGVAAAQTDPTTPTGAPVSPTAMHNGDMSTMHAQMPRGHASTALSSPAYRAAVTTRWPSGLPAV